MATALERIKFSFTRKQILSPKTDSTIKWELAKSLASNQADLYMIDAALIRTMYEGITTEKTREHATEVFLLILKTEPRKAIAQKNLMVTIRRLAVDGHMESAVSASNILIDANGIKKCLNSSYFMEAIECMASFDVDGSVKKLLDKFEVKEPEMCAESESFKRCLINNNEELNQRVIDLTEETNEDNPNMENNPKLWAGPV